MSITKWEGKGIERSADLPALVADTPSGKSASVEVWRKGSAKTLTVGTTNAERAKEEVAEEDKLVAPGRLRFAVRPLNSEERSEAGTRGGLIVEQVSGAAARAGIQRGDVLLSFNGTPVKSADELHNLVGKTGKSAALLIQRERQQLFVPVELG